VFPLCCCKHHHSLYFLVWHMPSEMQQFVTVSFFFSFSFLFSPHKNITWSSLFMIFQFEFLFFWFLNFISWSSYTNFICFWFSSSILICHVLFLLVQSLFFLLFFFLDPFVKIFLIFNFIIQFKFIVYYYFQFGPHSFNFFPFCLSYFSFQFTLQLKNLRCSLIYFLFLFSTSFFKLLFFLSFLLIDFFY